MYVTMRVSARDIAAGDRINGWLALTVEHTDTGAFVDRGLEGVSRDYYDYVGFVTLDRPCEDMVPCPECGDPMSCKRLDERALAITQGRCSECVAYPRRHAEQVARDRRVAAFGEGRC